MTTLAPSFLTLAQLTEDLKALPAYSPHLPTNVIAIRHECGEILAEVDTSEEDQLREELKAQEEATRAAEQDAKDATDRADAMETECISLRAEMAQLHDLSADGESVATYRERTLAAEAKTEAFRLYMVQAKRQVEEAEREMKALRARKGVTSGVFKNIHAITAFLSYVHHSSTQKDHVEQATALLKEIHAQ